MRGGHWKNFKISGVMITLRRALRKYSSGDHLTSDHGFNSVSKKKRN
jgi:hypothetical protein